MMEERVSAATIAPVFLCKPSNHDKRHSPQPAQNLKILIGVSSFEKQIIFLLHSKCILSYLFEKTGKLNDNFGIMIYDCWVKSVNLTIDILFYSPPYRYSILFTSL